MLIAGHSCTLIFVRTAAHSSGGWAFRSTSSARPKCASIIYLQGHTSMTSAHHHHHHPAQTVPTPPPRSHPQCPCAHRSPHRVRVQYTAASIRRSRPGTHPVRFRGGCAIHEAREPPSRRDDLPVPPRFAWGIAIARAHPPALLLSAALYDTVCMQHSCARIPGCSSGGSSSSTRLGYLRCAFVS